MAKQYIKWVPGPATLRWITRIHIRVYRWSMGLLGTRMDGLDILLLTSVGRKSGQKRTVPLPYFRDGDSIVLIASNGGQAKHPAWYHNIGANPDVELQLGRRKLHARAQVLEGQDRVRVWDHVVSDHPRYERYQGWTERQIPVISMREA